MRGIKVVSRSGNRTICMCTKCYEREIDEVELAIEYDLIQKPTVNDIGQCEMHCQEKQNEPAPTKRQPPRRHSPYRRKAHRRPR
jgi:hypothetical protein